MSRQTPTILKQNLNSNEDAYECHFKVKNRISLIFKIKKKKKTIINFTLNFTVLEKSNWWEKKRKKKKKKRKKSLSTINLFESTTNFYPCITRSVINFIILIDTPNIRSSS